jgi:hypothetical protein
MPRKKLKKCVRRTIKLNNYKKSYSRLMQRLVERVVRRLQVEQHLPRLQKKDDTFFFIAYQDRDHTYLNVFFVDPKIFLKFFNAIKGIRRGT